MRKSTIAIFAGFFAPVVAFAANEGVPAYYQTNAGMNANQAAYAAYADQGYMKYVSNGNRQILNTQTYSYQVPRQTKTDTSASGVMTPNGIAGLEEPATTVTAEYVRRFADFQFKTGVNSILEWDDMLFNEIKVGAQHNFSLRDFDLFVYGSYAYGQLEHGGLSMDYDLEPFDASNPKDGIFTISMGDLSGKTNHLKLGIGARHIWDIGGWKLSPSIGYEIFKHDLQMSNHIYPNPATYLPLVTSTGEYVFSDSYGNYYAIAPDYVSEYASDDLFQVCMTPEDIKVVPSSGGGAFYSLGDYLETEDYNDSMWSDPWGVAPGECVVVGGDGMVVVEGTTHIYNTTWSGFYLGLEIEKQMTLNDKLRLYMQVGMPKYSSEGIWPNRDDWQQNPSFLDEGSSGAYSYAAEIEYNFKLSDRLQLTLKADTNYFHVGKIGGELYVAEYSYWATDEDGEIIYDDYGFPQLITESAYTEQVSESLLNADWQSFSLHLGVKYAF